MLGVVLTEREQVQTFTQVGVRGCVHEEGQKTCALVLVPMQKSRQILRGYGSQRVEFGDAIAAVVILSQPCCERGAIAGFAIKTDTELELRLRLQGCGYGVFFGIPAGVEIGHDLVRVPRGVRQAAGVKQAVEVL